MTIQLFPVRVKFTAANPFGNSADLKLVAIGENGLDYAVKTGVVAASELLCYKVYQACGIGVPQYDVLEMPDKSLVFGSRIVSGVQDFGACSPIEKLDWFKDCALVISAICTLDFLIANDDRHQGNFLFVTGLNNRKACMAMDFSRAFLYQQWPLPDIWVANNNTTALVKGMRNMGFWNSSSATQSLLSATAIEATTWIGWVESLPSDWISTEIKIKIKDWWGDANFQQRLEQCMNEVK